MVARGVPDGVIAEPRVPAAPRWKWRRALFLLHSSVGVVLALYAVAIGLSGAALVFHDDMTEAEQRHACTPSGPLIAGPDAALDRVRESYPSWRILSLTHPNERCANWNAYLLRGDEARLVMVDAATGAIDAELDARQGVLGWVEHLHTNLFLGRWGRVLNGAAAPFVIMLSVSGIVLWWPGIGRLARVWRLDRGGQWPRRLWQLHGLAGVLLLLFLIPMAITGAYFIWPQSYITAIGRILPRQERLDSRPLVGAARSPLPWAALVAIAQREFPGRPLHRLQLPGAPGLPARITFREDHVDRFHKVSSVLLNPYTGEILQTDRLSSRPAGDSLVAWLSAFHFGVFAGFWIKSLWVVLGAAMAFLGISGGLVWWRRTGSRLGLRRHAAIIRVLVVGLVSAAYLAGAPRIASLSSPQTETVYALGAGAEIVGVTDVCEYPEQVLRDRAAGRVRVLGGFSNPDLTQVDALHPDLILTGTGFQKALAEQLRKKGYHVLHFEPHSLEDVFQGIEEIGAAVGKAKAAMDLTRRYRQDLTEIVGRNRAAPKVRVYLEVNHEGPWTVGHDSPLNDLIRYAGGANIFEDSPEGVFVTTHREIIERNPDIILSPIWIGAKVGGIDGIIPLAQIFARPGYDRTNAVRNSRVLYYDSALLKHEGPRQILAIRKLAWLLHPDLFPNPPETIPWELGRIR
jgi:ABC-type Fe3+-hydroxamate transport system substrate-binding protein